MCQVYFLLADGDSKNKRGIEHFSYSNSYTFLSCVHAPGRIVFMQITQKWNVNDNLHKYSLILGCWPMDLIFVRAELT